MIRHDLSDPESLRRCQEYFAEYTLLMRRGRGGQGSVYSAVHHSTGRKVAIKLLDGALVSERRRQRFLREIDLISRLRHPNIVTVYDFNLIDDHPYYVMDLISGLHIMDHVVVHNLDMGARLELFLRVCEAVSHAHRSGVIHRDLKPTNILVNEQGCPIVLDLGLGKAMAGPDDGASETCVVVGTIPYMSPEQSLGAEADALCDVYALGVILFELLTDELPVNTTGTREAVLDRLRNRAPLRLDDVLRDEPVRLRAIGRDLRAVVYKAIAKSPAQRYQSVAALAEDVRRCIAGQAIEARADQGLYMLGKAARRYRGTVAAALVVLLGLGLASWQRFERLQAEQDKLRAEGERAAALQAAEIAEQGKEEALQSLKEALPNLIMKGSIQSASVSRDQGRIHDAIALFREVITLGEAAAGSDPTVRRFVFEAHLRLSDLMISEKMFAEAEPHCHSALDLAMQESARDESNEDWQRHLGFAYRSAGRLALAQGRVEEANLLAESLVPLRRRLADAHPENDKLQLELSLALTLLAKCSSKNGDHARAWELHSESHHILSNLATCDPDNEDFAVELAFSRHHLAVWHMRQKTPEHDAQAEGLLNSVEQLVANDVGKNRAWEMQQLREATQTNLMKLARRRTGGDVPSQSASLE